jgi:predicted RNA-binding Zn-ribbon protein involved in translation (DUF1610 family)
MTSKEIRAMSFNTDNAWQDYFKLVQEIAALMAERDERTPAPEAASDIAIKDCPTCFTRMESLGFDSTHVLFQCPACGKQAQGATRQEWGAYMAYKKKQKLEAPEAASADEQFVAADAGVSVESVREAFAEPAAPPSDALSTFAEALLEESDKTCKVLYSDERSLVNRVLTKAISNLLPEVKP